MCLTLLIFTWLTRKSLCEILVSAFIRGCWFRPAALFL
nr:Hok/Gef family protein [Pseudescherichia sp.]